MAEKLRIASFVAEQTDNSERIEVRVYEDLDAGQRNRFQVLAVHELEGDPDCMRTLSTQALVACFEKLAPALLFAAEEVRIHLE